MSSWDSTALSSTVPRLRFRIPPSEATFSLASPSGQPESPACSAVFSPSSSRLPFVSPSSHRLSIRSASTFAGMRASLPMIGSIRIPHPGLFPSTDVRAWNHCPRNAFIFEFNPSRSLSLSKGRRNRCRLFTAPGNTSGGYSIGSGRSLGRQRSLKSTYR